ncbi:MAG: response regulator transcription factor [Arachnia sp.]
MSGPPIRVLVADDQPLIRYSLRALVEGEADLELAGEASTAREAVRVAAATRPDVVLMDIRMPDGDGIDATRAILADPASAGCRILVVSMFELDEYVYAALRAGASGFLLKDTEPDRLLEAIRRTHDGESLFAPSVLTRLVAHYVGRSSEAPTPPGVLTPREVEVLTLVGCGLTNHEVAAQLVISVKTVKTHIGSLLAKLQARDRAQLVIAAYEAGLVGLTRHHDRRGGTFEA